MIQGLLQGSLAIGCIIWAFGAVMIATAIHRGQVDSKFLELCAKWHPFGALAWPALFVAIVIWAIRETTKKEEP